MVMDVDQIKNEDSQPQPRPQPQQATGTKTRTPATIYYPTPDAFPTVSPESIIITIVSCIFGFPVLALFIICCLRRRAKIARRRERHLAGQLDEHGALNLVRFSPIHRIGLLQTRGRGVSLRRSGGEASVELGTVPEEKSDDSLSQYTPTS